MVSTSIHALTPQVGCQIVAPFPVPHIYDARTLLPASLVYLHDPLVYIVHLGEFVVIWQVLDLAVRSMSAKMPFTTKVERVPRRKDSPY